MGDCRIPILRFIFPLYSWQHDHKSVTTTTEGTPAGMDGYFYHELVQTVDIIRGYVCEILGIIKALMHDHHNNLE